MPSASRSPGRDSRSASPFNTFTNALGSAKVGPEEDPLHIDPFIKLFHGNTGFQTDPVEMRGNGGKDVYFETHNDFLFRSDENDSMIRFEVWEDDVGFLCDSKVDKTKFLKNPDQLFHEIVTMKDDQGWAAGTMRFDIMYRESENKFDLKVKSVIGLTIDTSGVMKQPGIKLLVVSLLAVVTYLIASVIFYMYASGVLKDDADASFVDALYFTVVTFTTVGYGDLYPLTDEGKWFTCFFSMLGLFVVIFFVGMVAEYTAEANAAAEVLARQELEDKMRKIEDGLEEADETSPFRKACKQYGVILLELTRDFCMLLCMVSIGSVAYYYEHEAEFIDCLHFAVQTATTIGFGDLSPSTENLRIFSIFYIPATVVVLLKMVGDVVAVPGKLKRMRMEKEIVSKFGGSLSPEEFAMLTNVGKHPQYITRQEFIFNMLLRLKKVSQHDVDRCARLFDTLDSDRNGVLTAADISPGSQDPLQRARTAATTLPTGTGRRASWKGKAGQTKAGGDGGFANDGGDTARSSQYSGRGSPLQHHLQGEAVPPLRTNAASLEQGREGKHDAGAMDGRKVRKVGKAKQAPAE